MGHLRELSESLLSGRQSPAEVQPFTPLWMLEPVADGVTFLSAFANVGIVETDAGLVLIDTGNFVTAAGVFGIVRGLSAAPLHTAVYTHGHVDHCFGVGPFDAEAAEAGTPRPTVVAHEAVPARFERYKLTGGYQSCINSRQFQMEVSWPTEYRYPDVMTRDALDLDVGGTRLELRHDRGETDDHLWAYLPQQRVLFTGDLFLWVFPNAGNPQKVQRYPREWAVALRKMAALGAEVLCPGHGLPIFGEAQVRTALVDTADALDSVVTQTLALMNQGARLDDILHAVRVPEPLASRPYLAPLYDEPEFVVRNVWRLYGGWYDGNPAHLKPAPDAELARELAQLCGGAKHLASRAEALARSGNLRLACHLAEFAVQSAPSDLGLWRVRAQVFGKRAETEASLMARGVYAAAARETPPRDE